MLSKGRQLQESHTHQYNVDEKRMATKVKPSMYSHGDSSCQGEISVNIAAPLGGRKGDKTANKKKDL